MRLIVFYKIISLVLITLLLEKSIANIDNSKDIAPTNLLILKKKKKRIYYQAGDFIVFSIKKSTINGVIAGISDSSIIVGVKQYQFSEIRSIVDPTGRFFPRLGQKVFIYAGLSYAFLSVINGAIGGQKPIIYEGQLVPSFYLLGSAGALSLLIKKKYNINRGGRGWEIQIIPQ